MSEIQPLNDYSLQRGLAELCRRDNSLSQVVVERGPPPFWVRPPGWKTLVKIILEQQVSLSSGRAVYRRLVAMVDPLTIANLKACSVTQLRQAGLTRQKAAYCHGLSIALAERTLSLSQIARQDNATARATLCELKGIGPWTADVYLLMALRRPDIWPPGDIALIRAINDLYGIDDADEIVALTNSWQPWRAIAARVLWHDYLERRNRKI